MAFLDEIRADNDRTMMLKTRYHAMTVVDGNILVVTTDRTRRRADLNEIGIRSTSR